MKSNLVVNLLRDGYKIINQQVKGHSLYYVNDVLMDYERNRDFFEAHKEADMQGLIVTRFRPEPDSWDVVLTEALTPPDWSDVTEGVEIQFLLPIEMNISPTQLTDEQIAEICKAMMIPVEVMFAWPEKHKGVRNGNR